MSETLYVKCRGFNENVVLTVKNSFIESELRKVLIEKDGDDVEDEIKYHNRSCVRLVLPGEAVSLQCSAWFNSLSEEARGQDQIDTETSEDINGNQSPPQTKTLMEFSDEEPGLTKSRDKFSCELCGVKFSSKRSLHIHEGRMHQDQTDNDLNSHSSSRHSKKSSRKTRKIRRERSLEKESPVLITETETELENNDSLCCKICGKIFDGEINLKKHVRRCHETTQKPCHICGMMVKELSIHIKHQHLQKDLNKYFCEFCGRGFKGYSGYQFHVAGHTGEKKYSCGGCSKNFRTSSEAKKCERGHAGIYKWNCSLCSYKCHQKNKFVRHMRTHTKSEPYSCPLCVHRAARKDYLQKHILKSHTGVSLEQVESLHPDMYNIVEKISFQEGKESRSTEEIKERVRESRLSVMKSVEQAETSESFLCDSVGSLQAGSVPVLAQQPVETFSVEESSELISSDLIVSTSPTDDLLRREVAYFKI